MDSLTTPLDAEASAIRFTGTWREYLPIAATNVALIIVTLGVYRFWAAARERRYLWSRTHVIDEPLEWTGTGKEMFIGFLIVMAFLVPFFLFIQFLFPALVARGKGEAAAGIFTLFYLGLFFLGGFARFRALRYRLSRSYWRGIRGGSDDPGWNFAGEYFGRHFLSAMTLFILFPWAAARLWNARWNQMSFGTLKFHANVDTDGLWSRWALLYLIPLLGMICFGLFMSLNGLVLQQQLIILLAIFLGLIYIVLPLITLHFFALLYRKAGDSTRLGALEFGFQASTWQWLKLFLGNIALAVVTLGFGMAYWGYRNWSFMVRHMRLYGEVDVTALGQSTTRSPKEAEGFADAFDIGAI